jgi:septal ring factor EnvC (AmiA/AmiB activator)
MPGPEGEPTGQVNIFTAIDLLKGLDPAALNQDDYLLLSLAQLAVISSVLATIGVFESDDECDYQFDAVSSTEETRFEQSVDPDTGVNDSLDNANIEAEELKTQITEINNDLQAATDFIEYLESEFDTTACP